MALFRNFGVNRRNRLCGVQEYASAQFLDFLELAENCSFLNRKLISALIETVDGHYLTMHFAIVNSFYDIVLKWESDDFLRVIGDIFLLIVYSAFFVLMTQAFMLLGMLEYFGRKSHTVQQGNINRRKNRATDLRCRADCAWRLHDVF
jgi:hypothetical protein